MSNPGNNTPSYMQNVYSRFGHHLSPNQRNYLSDSMISNLHSAKPGSLNNFTINSANTTSTTTNTHHIPPTTVTNNYNRLNSISPSTTSHKITL